MQLFTIKQDTYAFISHSTILFLNAIHVGPSILGWLSSFLGIDTLLSAQSDKTEFRGYRKVPVIFWMLENFAVNNLKFK